MGIYNKFKCIENTFSKYETINEQIENKIIKQCFGNIIYNIYILIITAYLFSTVAINQFIE